MKVKLESFLQEVSEKTTENNQYPVLTSSKAGLYLQSDYFNKQVASKDNTGYKIIKRGQFTYRAMSDTGEFFPNMLDCADIGIVSPAYPVFEIAKPIVIPEFLKYYFKSNGFQQSIASFAQGSTRTSIKYGKLKTVLLELPDLKEQQRYVEILDTAQRIINDRKKELEKLDDLIKARFVELFGDAVHNDKGWNTISVEDACLEIYGGGTPSKSHPEYYEDGDIPWVSSKDMKSDVLYGSQIYINQLGVENSSAKMVPVNSVIMVIRSGILKHTLPVAINAVPVTVNQDLKVFIPSEQILTRFLAVQFKMLEKDILSGVRAVTADNIEFNTLKERHIILPPVKLQKEFVDFCEQVDKSKVVAQQMLDEAQKLFDSLMQEYFG